MDESARRPKVTERLARLLEASDDRDRLEVIVTLDRPGACGGREDAGEASPELQRQRSRAQIERFGASLRQLEQAGEPLTVVDHSWLADSLLIRATPHLIRALAARPEVRVIDTNPEVGGVFSSRAGRKGDRD